MNSILHNDRQHLSALLDSTLQLAKDYFKKQKDLAPGRYIENIPLGTLPEKGIGAAKVLDLFQTEYADKITNSAGPRYFGFVTGGSTPAAVVGDWLVSTYDQNACGSNDSIAPQLERQTIHFMKQLFGLEEAYFGSFVTGATVSNFVSLAMARQWVGEQCGKDFSNEGITDASLVKVLSGTAHSSVIKSLAMLGIGRHALIKVEVLPEREAVDLTALENALKLNPDQHYIVVANAGTVNTVDFDDLEAIGKLKAKYHFWLHVDAAFGGFAALSDHYKQLMKGINYADSITIDAHKWLNVPYDAAMQFTRHKNLQLKVFQNSAAYLGDPNQSPDFFHYTPENSRRWRALPAWFALMAYGKEGHRDIVEHNCDMATLLGQWITASSDFKLLAPVRMNVVCFTLKEDNLTFARLQQFLAAVRDHGKVFFTPTVYKGTPGIRAALSNWQTTEEDIRITTQALTEVYQQKEY